MTHRVTYPPSTNFTLGSTVFNVMERYLLRGEYRCHTIYLKPVANEWITANLIWNGHFLVPFSLEKPAISIEIRSIWHSRNVFPGIVLLRLSSVSGDIIARTWHKSPHFSMEESSFPMEESSMSIEESWSYVENWPDIQCPSFSVVSVPSAQKICSKSVQT